MKYLISNDLQNICVNRLPHYVGAASVPAGTATHNATSTALGRTIGYEIEYFNATRTAYLGFVRVDHNNLSGLALLPMDAYRAIILNSAHYQANKLTDINDFLVHIEPAGMVWHLINPPAVAFQYNITVLSLAIQPYNIEEQPFIDLTYKHK